MAKRKYDPLWANITTEAANEIREQFAVLQETNERLKVENAELARALQEARQEVEQWKANAHHHGADAHRLASELVDAQKAVAAAKRETWDKARAEVWTALTFSDDIADNKRVMFDDLTMRDRAVNALEAAKEGSNAK